jgi:hypothetical protein
MRAWDETQRVTTKVGVFFITWVIDGKGKCFIFAMGRGRSDGGEEMTVAFLGSMKCLHLWGEEKWKRGIWKLDPRQR